MSEAAVLALDPGREKVGIAVVDEYGEALYLDIIQRSEIKPGLENLFADFNPEAVVIGDGTGSRSLAEEIKPFFSADLEINFMDEKDSSTEAVRLYRRQGGCAISNFLYKIISFRPSRPLDDYAALVLAQKYLRNK